jgi:pimeloyl-ACP methyl ester carboxylesterase
VVVAAAARPAGYLYVLHGIMGSSANWRTFARKLVQRRPEWGVVLVDLREHGRSQGAPPPHTVSTAAEDLHDLASVLEFDDKHIRAVCGHSFGGKVALQYRLLAGSRLQSTWVIDASPSSDANAMFARRTTLDSTVGVLDVLATIPARLEHRDQVIAELLASGLSEQMAHWLAMNWTAKNGGVELRIDLTAVRALLEDFYDRDLWEAIDDPGLAGDLHVIIAGRSKAVSGSDRDLLASLAARWPDRMFVHSIPEASHWVHADALDRVVDLIASHLPTPVP